MKNQQHSNHAKTKDPTPHKAPEGTAATRAETRSAAEQYTRKATSAMEEGTRTVEEAVKNGMKLQQEAAQWWMKMCMPASPGDIARQPAEAAKETILQTQKSMGLVFNLVEQNTRTGTDILQKTVAAMQAKTLPEAQTQIIGLWETAFSAVIETTRAITRANSRAVESWMNLIQGRPQDGKA